MRNMFQQNSMYEYMAMLLDKLVVYSVCSVGLDSQIQGVKVLWQTNVYIITIHKCCSCRRSELTSSIQLRSSFCKFMFRWG